MFWYCIALLCIGSPINIKTGKYLSQLLEQSEQIVIILHINDSYTKYFNLYVFSYMYTLPLNIFFSNEREGHKC